MRAWGVSKQRWCDTRVRIFFDGFLAFTFCSTRGAAKATGAAPTQSKPKKKKARGHRRRLPGWQSLRGSVPNNRPSARQRRRRGTRALARERRRRCLALGALLPRDEPLEQRRRHRCCGLVQRDALREPRYHRGAPTVRTPAEVRERVRARRWECSRWGGWGRWLWGELAVCGGGHARGRGAARVGAAGGDGARGGGARGAPRGKRSGSAAAAAGRRGSVSGSGSAREGESSS